MNRIAASSLNIATELFPEGEKGGLLLCGVNWGGSPSEAGRDEPASFFSDRNVNNYPYRNRLVRWFSYWGHPLEQIKGREGPFERSIVQTNWLYGQSENMRGKDIASECSASPDAFFLHLDQLQPKLVLLVGISLLEALNSTPCLALAARSLGVAQPPLIYRKDVFDGSKKLRAFRVGVQSFENGTVIALPHPTGSIGLSDRYIEAFRPELGPELATFKNGLTAGFTGRATGAGS